jgi:putative ABC transport system permease protein
LLIVTFLALAAGTGIGAAASVPTANYMLQNQISSLQSEQAEIQQNFGRPGSDSAMGQPGGGRGGIGGFFNADQNADYITQINAVINGRVLVEIAGIGILLVLLSSGMSSIFISRYEPLKILSSLS